MVTNLEIISSHCLARPKRKPRPKVLKIIAQVHTHRSDGARVKAQVPELRVSKIFPHILRLRNGSLTVDSIIWFFFFAFIQSILTWTAHSLRPLLHWCDSLSSNLLSQRPEWEERHIQPNDFAFIRYTFLLVPLSLHQTETVS